jgi:hypothetical protein
MLNNPVELGVLYARRSGGRVLLPLAMAWWTTGGSMDHVRTMPSRADRDGQFATCSALAIASCRFVLFHGRHMPVLHSICRAR